LAQYGKTLLPSLQRDDWIALPGASSPSTPVVLKVDVEGQMSALLRWHQMARNIVWAVIETSGYSMRGGVTQNKGYPRQNA
jgi:hypothetical protein